METRGTILAVLQCNVGIAGLILVFAGLLLAKGESFFNTKRGDKYRRLALLSLVPMISAIISSWISISALEGNEWAVQNLLLSFKLVLALTGFYAIIGTILSAYP